MGERRGHGGVDEHGRPHRRRRGVAIGRRAAIRQGRPPPRRRPVARRGAARGAVVRRRRASGGTARDALVHDQPPPSRVGLAALRPWRLVARRQRAHVAPAARLVVRGPPRQGRQGGHVGPHRRAAAAAAAHRPRVRVGDTDAPRAELLLAHARSDHSATLRADQPLCAQSPGAQSPECGARSPNQQPTTTLEPADWRQQPPSLSRRSATSLRHAQRTSTSR